MESAGKSSRIRKLFALTGDLDKVVDEISACIDGYRKVPLPTDHLKINKYSGPHDPSYAAVYPLIIDMAQNAKQIVEGRLNRKRT